MSIHLLYGLFYLVLTAILLFFYFLVPFCLLIFFRKWRKRKASKKTEKNQLTRRNLALRLPFFVFIVILVFNALFYMRQRSEWMGNDNVHLTAKEYYVSGQVLYLYRSLLTRVIHPENILLRPLNALQENIYNVGSKYLPENDGEIGLWMNNWLIYPYSKRFRIPKGYASYTNDQEIAPMLVKFLDRVWFSIESVATKPIADKQMYEQHYLRNFAGMAHFYVYQKRGYAPGNNGSLYYLSKFPKHIHRSEMLITWLGDLKKRWLKSSKAQEFLQKNPEVEVMSQIARIIEFGLMVVARINSDNFTCDDPYWLIYQQTRGEFVGGEEGKAAWQRMNNRQKAEKFKYVAMQSGVAKFDSYIFNKYCGISLPGKIDWSHERKGRHKGQTLNEAIEYRLSSYRNEFRKLEEQFNGNQ